MKFLKKLKLELPHDLAIPPLSMYPKERRSVYTRNTCTSMLTTALFAIVKLWNQPSCPSTDD
jgi:hypothetical protein